MYEVSQYLLFYYNFQGKWESSKRKRRIPSQISTMQYTWGEVKKTTVNAIKEFGISNLIENPTFSAFKNLAFPTTKSK